MKSAGALTDMARILRCIDSVAAHTGGPAYSVVRSSEILANRGHHVTVLTCDPNETGDSGSHTFRLLRGGRSFGRYRVNIRYLLSLLRELKRYDFVTVHGVWQFASVAFFLVNLWWRKPYVVMPHGSLDVWDSQERPLKRRLKAVYWRLIESHIYRRSMACYFTTAAEQLVSTGAFAFKGIRHNVIPYGVVDPGYFRGNVLPSDASRIVYLGRLHPKKGVELLLQALSAAVRDGRDLQLSIAGDGSPVYVASLHELVRTLGLTGRVTWVGHVSGENKYQLLRDSGLFVLASHQENFGLAVAEALACGTPVAISERVQVAEYVTSCAAGFVFERTQEDLTRILSQWAERRWADGAIRTNARECFRKHMSLERFVDHLEENHGLRVQTRGHA